jgi:hypothetical protein
VVIFKGARGERKADSGSLKRKVEGFTDKGKGFVINYNKFARVGRCHNSDFAVKIQNNIRVFF